MSYSRVNRSDGASVGFPSSEGLSFSTSNSSYPAANPADVLTSCFQGANPETGWLSGGRFSGPLAAYVSRYEMQHGPLPQEFARRIASNRSLSEYALFLAHLLEGQAIEVFSETRREPLPLLISGVILGRGSSAIVLEGILGTDRGPLSVALRLNEHIPDEEVSAILSLLEQEGIGQVRFWGSTTAGGKFGLVTNRAVGKVISHLVADLIGYRDEDKQKIRLQIMSDMARITALGIIPIDPQFILGPALEVQWIDFEMWRYSGEKPDRVKWKMEYAKVLKRLELHPQYFLEPQEAFERQRKTGKPKLVVAADHGNATRYTVPTTALAGIRARHFQMRSPVLGQQSVLRSLPRY